MPDLIADATHEYRRMKRLCDQAVAGLSDEQFFRRPVMSDSTGATASGSVVNPIALIVKHVAGNLRSRWTDFLTTDGDKPDRHRDSEFVLSETDTRAALIDRWETGWSTLFATLATLTPADLSRTVTIRREPHTVQLALLRNLTHTSYHTGQILYVARLLNPTAAWLTIAPNQSAAHQPSYTAAR